MKKLIAVALLGLAGVQGVAVANENNTYTEAPFAAREFVPSGTIQGVRNYDLVDRYNP
jgi:Tfp pilus assembly protein PilV